MEAKMSQKRIGFAVVALLAFSAVLFLSSCQKLSVDKLQANYHFSKANQLFKDGKFRKAIAEYESTLKYNPEAVDAYRFLGESYKSLFKPGNTSPENMETANKALAAFKKAYEVSPTSKEVIFSLGDMYDKLRNIGEAEKYYLMILDLEPENMGNYYVVAEFYKRYASENESLKAKAESMYLRRIELDPDNPQGYAYMANYYDQITPIPDFDRAVEYHYRRAKLDPNNAEVYYSIGVNRFYKAYRLQNVLSTMERNELGNDSIKALMKAVELSPNYPEPYAYLNLVNRNVFAKIFPDKEARYVSEADRWTEKFQEVRKRAIEKEKLEKELKKTG
jgi:tetratricopeptide (TPR) repeat protein